MDLDKEEFFKKMQNTLGVIDEDDQDYFTMVYNNFWRSPKYTIYEKAVFVSLKGYAGNSVQSFPGQGTIAKDLMISRKKVNETLSSLASKGVIVILKQKTSSNKKTVNRYILPKVDRNTGEFILSSLDKYKILIDKVLTFDHYDK